MCILEGVYIHPQAIVKAKKIGKGTRIWAFAHILEGAKIGRNVNIGDHCYIENEVIIGNNVVIKNGISIWDGVRIEDKVFLGPNMAFTNSLRPRAKDFAYELRETLIKTGASIGANATIICGIKIGKNALIGAGSVVTKDVADYALVYGNPAIIRGYVCECGKNLQFEDSKAYCKCGKIYSLKYGICTKLKGR